MLVYSLMFKLQSHLYVCRKALKSTEIVHLVLLWHKCPCPTGKLVIGWRVDLISDDHPRHYPRRLVRMSCGSIPQCIAAGAASWQMPGILLLVP